MDDELIEAMEASAILQISERVNPILLEYCDSWKAKVARNWLKDMPQHDWTTFCTMLAKAVSADALAAIRAAGYAVVPVEPTEAMLSAGADAWWETDQTSHFYTLEAAWPAMVAAAQEAKP